MSTTGSKDSIKGSLFGDDEEEQDTFITKQSLSKVFDTNPAKPVDASKAPVDRRSSMNGSSRLSVKERLKVTTETEDPLSRVMLDSYDPVMRVTKENLSIRKEDEARIVAALHSAAKKQTTGAIYSVVVDLGKTGTLGIGVKDLGDNVLAVSMLKRENCCPGAGEDAGIRLGDIIFGVNFMPTREGSKTLIGIIKKESARGKSHIHVQGWRCHQLCSDSMPGYQFPRADEVLVQAYSLVQNKVFSDWERWNFIEILLGHMLEDLKMRTNEDNGLNDSTGSLISPSLLLRAKQMQVLDLERNILQAKGLRTALCVRVVHTKSHGDTVVYVLRVEDVESGLQWVVQRRYSDFFALNEELLDMMHFAKEVEFPRKRLSIRNTAKLVEMRIVALEQYMRRMLHILTLYATMDSSASRTLRHLQTFLGVDNYLDCVHPPILDDQRFIELMAYRFLNDFGSEACQQCVRFITTVDLEAPVETGPDGYIPVLNFMRDALSEVEQFVQQQHLVQMTQTLEQRRPDLSPEQLRSFVRKCIRRQVEAALYLPLRRTVFRIVFSFLTAKSKSLQRAITLLQRATPKFLMVDPFVTRAPALPRTVKAFRRVIQAYLPADQGQLLIQAATAVMELHKECQAERNRLAAAATAGVAPEEEPDEPLLPVASKRSGSDDVEFDFVSTKTPDLDIGLLSAQNAEERNKLADGELPEPPKRQVVQKLRDLFTRKKTSEDLFASSDSETEEPGAPTVDPQTPTGGSTNTSTPSTPQRSKFIARLIPRPASSVHNPDNADNLFVDEKQAFTVSVKSSDSGQDQRSSASSGTASPTPSSVSGGRTVTDDVLSTIQKHIAGLHSASVDNARGDNLSPRRSQSDGIAAESFDSAGAENMVRSLEDLKISTSGSAHARKEALAEALAEAEASTKSPIPAHDSSVLMSLHGLETATGNSTAESEESPRPDSSAVHTPSTLSMSTSAGLSGLHKGVLESLVSINTELKKQQQQQSQVRFREAPHDSEAPTLSGSASTEELGKGSAADSVYDPSVEEANALRALQGKEDDIEDAVNNMRDGSIVINNSAEETQGQYEAISADDFLPLFTYVLIQAGLPQLLLVKELMTALVNDEDSYGECGYYLATLEAATQHIFDLAEQYEKSATEAQQLDANGEDVLDAFDAKLLLH